MQTIFNKRIDTYEQENPIFRVVGSEHCKKYCKKIFEEKLITLIKINFLISITKTNPYGE